MSAFPNLSNIEPSISKAIKDKANASLANSGKLPWFRLVTFAGPEDKDGNKGLVINSINPGESFSTRYGSLNTAGIVGYKASNYPKSPVVAGKVFVRKNSKGEQEKYTEGGTSFENRGLRPNPIIENLKVENGTEGLTRNVSFTIKCFTLAQAEVVSQHYLDAGSYVLVEWGWNTQKSFSQLAGGGGKIDPCDLVHYSNLAVLKDKRKASEGTYDAVLAVITKGGITYGDDESYLVQVNLTSQGEMPAYLRSQTGGLISPNQAATGIKFTQGELDQAEDEETGNVGKFLFMQMYNDLPLSKQIGKIKDFQNGEDSNGIPWTHPANFLNMDEEVREDLVESLKNVKLRSSEEDTLKVPEDVPLFSNERFIRFELAFEILKTIDSVQFLNTPCGSKTLSDGTKINPRKIQDISINETICRAHKHIFSTDKTKLFIPNTNLPDFRLNDFLKNTEAATGSLDPFEQDGSKKGVIATINAHPNPSNGGDSTNDSTIFAFPATKDIEVTISYDTTIVKKEPKAHNYGYLKNLYVNYNFFLDVMQRPGLMMHECLMEILNGMSSACNLFWDFQIYEVGDPKEGNIRLEVFDKTFLGMTEQAYQKDNNGIPGVITTIFQSRGILSPFLDASMDMSIAGDMMNQIIMQKNKPAEDSEGNTDPNLAGYSSNESEAQNLKTGLFSSFGDPVSKILDKLSNDTITYDKAVDKARQDAYTNQEEATKDERSFWNKTKSAGKWLWGGTKSVGSSIGDTARELWTGDNKKQAEVRKSNFKYLSTRAGVLPKINDRNQDYDVANEWYDLWSGNNAKLEDVVFIGTWNDPILLKKYQLYDHIKATEVGKDDFNANPVLVPVKFEFTIHGISGLKVGDCFIVSDLPKRYNDKIFQITQINHEVGDLWKTTVEAQMRNV